MSGSIEHNIEQMLNSGGLHSLATHDDQGQALAQPQPTEATTSPLGELPESQTAEPPQQAPEQAQEPQETDPEVPPHEQEMTAEDRAKKLARDLREARRRLAKQEAEIAVHRGQRQETVDEQTQRLIEQRAAQQAQAQLVNQKCNEIYQQGVKAFGRGDFDEAVSTINEGFGQQMGVVMETLIDIPNADKLIQHLANDPDKLDDLVALSPHRLGAALAKEAAKLAAPQPRQISKAPAPTKSISTRSTAEPNTNPESMSMDQFAKWFSDPKRQRTH